jgi:hypothetical protein
MIIISASIQKSGSTFRYLCEKELLAASGKRSGQAELEKKFTWGYIPELAPKIVLGLWWLSIRKGSFIVKTHSCSSRLVRLLAWLGFVRTTFSYRHPIDIVLSAVDHNKKTMAGLDKQKGFLTHTDLPTSARLVKAYTRKFRSWKQTGHVLFIQYETFAADLVQSLTSIVKHCSWFVPPEKIEAIARTFESNKDKTWNYNKGVAFRYLQTLDEATRKHFLDFFKDDLQEMGYVVNE